MVVETPVKPVDVPVTAPKRVTAVVIRERFPNPSTFFDKKLGRPVHGLGDYCVGGAFMRYYGFDDWGNWFPPAAYLVVGLRRVNPSLSVEIAKHFAGNIVHHNECQEYDRAWETLDSALAWTP